MLAPAVLQRLLLAQDVAPDDLPECFPKLADAVGVDKGVDDRVGMREDYRHVQDRQMRAVAVRTEEGEAVDDVQGQPADCKQTHDDGQGLGSLDFFLQSRARLLSVEGFHLHQLELMPCCHEDAQVDGQHQNQGDQDTGKKVKVDHVLHVDHVLKQAVHQAGRAGAVGALWEPVPAHHGRQTDDDGQSPADGDDSSSPLACHQTVVPKNADGKNIEHKKKKIIRNTRW